MTALNEIDSILRRILSLNTSVTQYSKWHGKNKHWGLTQQIFVFLSHLDKENVYIAK